ncbi:MAG: diguanylate cyclase [Prochloraceae cyanobacterium]
MMKFKDLFFSTQYITHEPCALWPTGLFWLQFFSHSLILLAYYLMGLSLLYLVRQREKLPFKGIFVFLSLLLFISGTTHLIAVWTLWHPAYWLLALSQGLTALLACYMVISNRSVVPLILALTNPSLLETFKQALEQDSRKLQSEEKELERFFNLSLDLFCVAGTDGYFKLLNPAFEKTLSYSKEELLAQPFINFIHPDDRASTLAELEKISTGQPTLYFENRYRTQGGDYKWLAWTAFPVAEESLLYCVARDMTEHKQAEAKLQHDALHDSLTGLPNRSLLMECLNQALKRQQRHPERQVGLLFLDLDRFKIINDRLGHLTGDQLLIDLTQRLKKCQRASDIIARLGGDEFVILLEEFKNQDQVINVAERIHQALKKPFMLNNRELFVSASIGIALTSNQVYSEPAQLLRDADTAMYSAKARGQSCHAVFEPSMRTCTLKQLHLGTSRQSSGLKGDLKKVLGRLKLKALVDRETITAP